MDTTLFSYSLFFSIVGIGFYIFGRKNNFYFYLAGIALMVFPYFVSSISIMLIIGIFLLILPFILNWLRPI